MSTLTKTFAEEALALSPLDRVQLADKLLSSLDMPGQSSMDEKWAKESEGRIHAFENGEIAATEATAVFERLERKFFLLA